MNIKTKLSKNQQGIAHVAALLVTVLIVSIIGLVGFRVYQTNTSNDLVKNQENTTTEINQNNPNTETSPPKTTESIISPPVSSTATPEPVKVSPPASITYPTIVGDSNCQTQTKAALDLLYQKARSHFETVKKYIGVIECSEQGSGMFAYETPTRFLAGATTRNAGAVWYAGTIVHDAGHSKLYNDYRADNPNSSVPGEVWTGQSAEATCLAVQADALQQIGADQSTIDYVNNVLKTEYWNVPYSERWW